MNELTFLILLYIFYTFIDIGSVMATTTFTITTCFCAGKAIFNTCTLIRRAALFCTITANNSLGAGILVICIGLEDFFPLKFFSTPNESKLVGDRAQAMFWFDGIHQGYVCCLQASDVGGRVCTSTACVAVATLSLYFSARPNFHVSDYKGCT